MCYNVVNLADSISHSFRHFMSRRPAVLQTPPHDVSNFALSCIRVQKSETHPVTFQSLARSLQKPRVSPKAFFQLRNFSQPSNLQTCELSNALSPLEATLTADLRVLAEINRNCQPATPLDATLTEISPVTPLSATLTKNRGEGEPPTLYSATPLHPPHPFCRPVPFWNHLSPRPIPLHISLPHTYPQAYSVPGFADVSAS
jgi:hypothetical protein